MFSRFYTRLSVCLSLCLSVCNALTFENLDLGRSFLVRSYVFSIFMLCSFIKVIGTSRSRSQEQECVCGWSAFDWKAFFWIRAWLVDIIQIETERPPADDKDASLVSAFIRAWNSTAKNVRCNMKNIMNSYAQRDRGLSDYITLHSNYLEWPK